MMCGSILILATVFFYYPMRLTHAFPSITDHIINNTCLDEKSAL